MSKERENRETQFYTSQRNIKKRNVHTLLYARDVWTFYQSICTFNFTYFVFVLLFQSIHEQTVQTPIWSIVCLVNFHLNFAAILSASLSNREWISSFFAVFISQILFLFADRSILLNIRPIRSLNRLILCSCV